MTDVNSVTRTIFPQLTTLGISKNYFSCDYLATFLPPWHDNTEVELIIYKTNKTNIDGVDCRHENLGVSQVTTSSTIIEGMTRRILGIKNESKPKQEPNSEEKNAPEILQETDKYNNHTEMTDRIDETTEFEDKRVTRFECDVFSPIMNSESVHVPCDHIEDIDTSCMGSSLQINLNDDDEIVFRLSKINSEFRCSKETFQRLKYLNISGNQLQNNSKIIALLGSSIEALDLSSNSVQKLDTQIFKRFINLKYLNLSKTNLSSFKYSLFFNQQKLQVLDISFNRLKRVNFTKFLRNFKALHTLNLEGNDLNEVDSITKTIFPALSSLGISRNRFTCEYLATFLSQWDNLELMKNPSDETHIDGVDCREDAESTTKRIETKKGDSIKPSTKPKSSFDSSTAISRTDKSLLRTKNIQNQPSDGETNHIYHVLMELRALKYLFLLFLLLLCAMSCGYLVVKSNIIHRIRQTISRNSMDDEINQQYYHESTHTSVIELAQRETN